MVSAGEVHTPGRPRDIVGLKAMAITAQRCFSNFRASGVKVHAGAPVIEPGMEEHDFEELAAAGVRFLGEVGLGGVKDGPTARKMVAWARKYGINSTIHTGGPSIPGSGLIDKDIVLEADTDVIGHINGGHTALPDDQIVCLCEGCKRGLELVHNGNERAALFTLRTAKERGELNRVILGTDAPAGSGVQPLGILRMVTLLASLGDVPAEVAFCFATGNTARMRALDCGLIEVGRAADFVFMDRAQHSAGKTLLESVRLGDLPGVGMTVIDGVVRSHRSRNTPPAEKAPAVVVALSQPPQQSDERRAFVFAQRLERFFRDQRSDRRGAIVEIRARRRQRDEDTATVARIWTDRGEAARCQAIDDSLDRRGVHRGQAAEMILRTIAKFPQFGERGPLGRREVLDHLSGENRGVTLLRLTQRKADLFVEDVGLLPIVAALNGGAPHSVTGYHSHGGVASRLKPRDERARRAGRRIPPSFRQSGWRLSR